MILRHCAGGVVFKENKVFLLKNEKGEWVLPKGKIRNGFLSTETALFRVKEETGLEHVDIISTAGETCYEFYSFTRQKQVFNEVVWYLMETADNHFKINKGQGFTDGGFYNIEDAINMITYNQDKSLVNLSYKKYKKLLEQKVVLA